jgi:hypothetical protein
MLSVVREGDTVIIHSMDRLAPNLDDLRRVGCVGGSVDSPRQRVLPNHRRNTVANKITDLSAPDRWHRPPSTWPTASPNRSSKIMC